MSDDTISKSSAVAPPADDGDVTLSDLPRFCELAKSSDPAQRLQGTKMLRALLSVEDDPPIAAVIESEGVLRELVASLSGGEQQQQLQFESAWALSNIASGSSDGVQRVVCEGAVAPLVALILSDSSSEECRDQAAWALGNVVGDSTDARDMVLAAGAMPALLESVMSLKKPSNTVWCIMNLTRGKPRPDVNLVVIALPVLVHLLQHDDADVLVDALWALSNIAEGSAERLEAVIQSGAVPFVTRLLTHADLNVVTPALRIIGNISASDNSAHCRYVVECGTPVIVGGLLNQPGRRRLPPTLLKEAAWIISNILAEGPEEAERLLQTRTIVPALVNLLTFAADRGDDGDDDEPVRREALFGVASLLQSGVAPERLADLAVELDLVKKLATFLDGNSGAKLICLAIESLEILLTIDEELAKKDKTQTKRFAETFAESGVDGLAQVEALQEHSNHSVYAAASNLLMRHFPEEEEEEQKGEE